MLRLTLFDLNRGRAGLIGVPPAIPSPYFWVLRIVDIKHFLS